MNIAQGKLAIVDGRVFWNGVEVVGLVSIFMHVEDDSSRIKFEVSGGDEAVLTEMEATGIKIRRMS